MSNTLTGDPTLVTSGFNQPPDNPLLLLQNWLKMADALNVSEPGSLVLSTLDAQNRPASRVVLLKGCDDTGVIFASSRDSAKGQAIAANPWVAGNLWWRETMQQVNFQGRAQPLSARKSDQLFQARSRQAQAVAAVSHQSNILMDEQPLKHKIMALVRSDNAIIRPHNWFAYHITITTIEFWLGSKDRFHQRLQYSLADEGWSHERLQP